MAPIKFVALGRIVCSDYLASFRSLYSLLWQACFWSLVQHARASTESTVIPGATLVRTLQLRDM